MILHDAVERFLLRYAATTQTSHRRALRSFQNHRGKRKSASMVQHMADWETPF